MTRRMVGFGALIVLAMAAPASAQEGPMTCSQFLAMSESSQDAVASGLIVGYAVAAGLAGQMASHMESDTLAVAAMREFERRMNPDADQDSLRQAMDSFQRGRKHGAKMVADYVNRRLELDPGATSMELTHRIAALCSRPDNASQSVGFIFAEILDKMRGSGE